MAEGKLIMSKKFQRKYRLFYDSIPQWNVKKIEGDTLIIRLLRKLTLMFNSKLKGHKQVGNSVFLSALVCLFFLLLILAVVIMMLRLRAIRRRHQNYMLRSVMVCDSQSISHRWKIMPASTDMRAKRRLSQTWWHPTQIIPCFLWTGLRIFCREILLKRQPIISGELLGWWVALP